MRAYALALSMESSTPPLRSILENLGIHTMSASSQIDMDTLPPLFLETVKETLYTDWLLNRARAKIKADAIMCDAKYYERY